MTEHDARALYGAVCALRVLSAHAMAHHHLSSGTKAEIDGVLVKADDALIRLMTHSKPSREIPTGYDCTGPSHPL